MTDVAILQKSGGNGFNYNVYLLNHHYDPNQANDLTWCGYQANNIRNERNEAEVVCQQPMKSQYVILNNNADAMWVCEFYVYSRLSGYLL